MSAASSADNGLFANRAWRGELNPYAYVRGRVLNEIDAFGLRGDPVLEGPVTAAAGPVPGGHLYHFLNADEVGTVNKYIQDASRTTPQERLEAAQAGMKASVIAGAEAAINAAIKVVAVKALGPQMLIQSPTVELPKPADPGASATNATRGSELSDNYKAGGRVVDTVVAASPFAAEGMLSAAVQLGGRLRSIAQGINLADRFPLLANEVGSMFTGPLNAIPKVHGNSVNSTKAQHVYEVLITDSAGNTKTWKFGVSGAGETAGGKSIRAENQVRNLNTSNAGQLTFSSSILSRIPGAQGARKAALALERAPRLSIQGTKRREARRQHQTMSKLVRLTDFQVYLRIFALPDEEQRTINRGLFTSFEPVRLWLKERQVQAPFRKILVSLSDETLSAPWHGHVANAVGVCDVTEALPVPLVKQNADNHHWVLGIVSHALNCVHNAVHWRCEDLERFVVELRDRPLPLVHYFESLAQVDKNSRVKCLPWFSTRPGFCEVGVRFTPNDAAAERDVTVFRYPGALELEDDFPIHKSAIRGNDFLLLDKSGKVLASAPIDKAALH